MIGQTLRLIAIRTLKERWTTRIIVLRDGDPVVGGIFKYIRHPNYLGVIWKSWLCLSFRMLVHCEFSSA